MPEVVTCIHVTHDNSFAAFGTKDGSCSFVTLPSFDFSHCLRDLGGAVRIIETLPHASLCALVVGSQRQLQLWDHQQNRKAGTIAFPASTDGAPIVTVLLSRRRLVAFLDAPCNEVWIFDLQTLRVLRTLERKGVLSTRASSPTDGLLYGAGTLSLAGVAALSRNPLLGLLAAPVAVPVVELPGGRISADAHLVGSSAGPTGAVALLEINGNVRVTRTVKVAENPVAALALNSACSLLLSCSLKGTIIRCWSIPTVQMVFCWRRGVRPSSIVSLGFTETSSFAYGLSVSTCGEKSHTLHLFACARDLPAAAKQIHLPPNKAVGFAEEDAVGPFGAADDGGKKGREEPDEKGEEEEEDYSDWATVGQEDIISESRSSSTASSDLGKLHINKKLRKFAATAKGALRQKLNDLIFTECAEFLGRESSVLNAPKAFAVAHLRHPPISLSSPSVPYLLVTPSVSDSVDRGEVEVRLLSANGCAVLFTGNRYEGGKMAIRQEMFFTR